MRQNIIVFILTGTLITTAFLLSFTPVHDQILNSDSSDRERSVEVPTWQKSEYWTFSVKSFYGENSVIDLVCYDISDGNYYIGSNSREHALVHAVYNTNPMLGRMTIDNLDVYENGVPKSLYQFPLKDGSQWKSTLYEKDLNANAKLIDNDQQIKIIAVAEDGFTLIYNYVPELNWFSTFNIIDEEGREIFSLELIEHNYNYQGTVYFMRATDLYTTSNLAASDGDFSVSGHSKYGDFDFLAVGIKSYENIRMVNTVLVSPDNVHYRIGSGNYNIYEIPAEKGIWTADLYTFPIIFTFTKPVVELQISGVIEYSTVL